jgi:hypothetical protein
MVPQTASIYLIVDWLMALLAFRLNSVKMPESVMNWNGSGRNQHKNGAAPASVWCDLEILQKSSSG